MLVTERRKNNEPIIYTVRPGNTLFAIAQLYGTTAVDIKYKIISTPELTSLLKLTVFWIPKIEKFCSRISDALLETIAAAIPIQITGINLLNFWK